MVGLGLSIPAVAVQRRPGFVFDFTQDGLPNGATFQRASTATYFDADSILRTAAANVLRIDRDPVTGAVRGALIEPEATNLVRQSGDVLASPWVISGTTTTRAQASPAPLMQSFTRLAKTTSPAGDVRHAQGVAVNTRAIFSAFVKRGNVGSEANFQCHWTGGSGTQAMGVRFDFNALTVVAVQATTAAAGWERVSPNTFRVWCEGQPTFSQTNANYLLATGQMAETDFEIWGVQYEYGSGRPSSYVPTTTATVARSADQLTLSLPAGLQDLNYTFDDGSSFVQRGVTGEYLVPTTLARRHIRYIEARAAG